MENGPEKTKDGPREAWEDGPGTARQRVVWGSGRLALRLAVESGLADIHDKKRWTVLLSSTRASKETGAAGALPGNPT